ncbi:hypothetical protein NMG60_11034615 [Bertholletia excelsa]
MILLFLAAPSLSLHLFYTQSFNNANPSREKQEMDFMHEEVDILLR